MVSDRFRTVSDFSGRFQTVFGLFRMVSDHFRTVSDGFGPFSDRFGRFRIVFGSFRTVSDRFRIVSDGFGSFSDRFGPFSNVFRPFSDDSALNLKFQISIGQGWDTAVTDRRSDPSGPTVVPRPAPALAN